MRAGEGFSVESMTDELTIRSYTFRTRDRDSPYEYVCVYPNRPGIVAQGETFQEAYWKGRALYENAMRRAGR